MTQAPGALQIPTVVDYERTLILAIELSHTSWVLAAQTPGLPGVKAKRSTGVRLTVRSVLERSDLAGACRQKCVVSI